MSGLSGEVLGVTLGGKEPVCLFVLSVEGGVEYGMSLVFGDTEEDKWRVAEYDVFAISVDGGLRPIYTHTS